jgi:hypothetical protein
MIFNALVVKYHMIRNYLKQGKSKKKSYGNNYFYLLRYSTLLATIESLSFILKFVQIASSNSLIHHLRLSIEQRMEQLNKLVQLSLTVNARQQRQDVTDDDFLSFRSAFSSYEHLLNMSS